MYLDNRKYDPFSTHLVSDDIYFINTLITIDGLSDILNKSTIIIGGSLGGKRINHLLHADDLCIVSLSSAGIQQLLSICDKYCAAHSVNFNVRKSVCMFFKSEMNKLCDNVSVVLSDNNIEFVHETVLFGLTPLHLALKS